MLYNQRDIVIVSFPLKQGNAEHPAIIISNDFVNSLEETYLCLMLTSSKQEDEFAFKIEATMVNKPMPKESTIRLCLFSTFTDTNIVAKLSQLKSETFKLLLEKFDELILQAQDADF